jgi:hypothetical protein
MKKRKVFFRLFCTIRQWRYACLLCLCMSVSFAMYSPSGVRGNVRSIDGGALQGVTVMEKSSGAGALTDANGLYSITVPRSVDITVRIIYQLFNSNV